jgi:hypothetical protein
VEERAIVQCANCGTPGAVVFDGDTIVKAFFPCKCPRPTVDEANRANKEITTGLPASLKKE